MTGTVSAAGAFARIKELELRGYTLLPDLLDSMEVAELRPAVSYRPAWARSASPVREPEAGQLDRLPADIRPYLGRLSCGLANTMIVNWREDLPIGGRGLGPRRWSRNVESARGESGAASDQSQTTPAP